MPARHLIVFGASGGGIEALRALVSGLRADFPAQQARGRNRWAVGIDEATIPEGLRYAKAMGSTP